MTGTAEHRTSFSYLELDMKAFLITFLILQILNEIGRIILLCRENYPRMVSRDSDGIGLILNLSFVAWGAYLLLKM